MPITRPCESSSGPPELPGLMRASVWMSWSSVEPRSERLSAEITPVVTVRSKPSGLPMATAVCPTTSRSESPIGRAGRVLHRRLHHRHVDARVAAEHARRQPPPVGEGQEHLLRGADHVRVGTAPRRRAARHPDPDAPWRSTSTTAVWRHLLRHG
jgi:hypothetical protein